jgi:alkaline phosphatase
LVDQADDLGYRIVNTKADLLALRSATQDEPLLGLFASSNLPVRYTGPAATVTVGSQPAIRCTDNPSRPATQPTLSDMTTKAIALLNRVDKRFFLQVEGASIDKRDHSADACGQIGETVDLDEAVQAAMVRQEGRQHLSR